ncbi:LysR family transcriptional regulator [Sediminivirga luteola]|uniref:HTH lysR-type domain-containing protein n=1 Tax=Sediminivirga luteola TaxID=1774748 RepID=A0A8J2XAZ2_9MICO|nr:LysR family transcriptional regulator [Sediminivirga luteola]MCI2264752.1 LysR family transcriptional regulator [Sediminivirga luteola]GGA01989.1 hypothetical protein GCM10011333_00640 [Sediminivirga luteola]
MAELTMQGVRVDWTLTQLRTFVAVADAGSMSRAAQLLGYTPGAVSQHMAALRKAAQHELFVKDGRHRRLTEAGETLLQHARAILAAEARASEAMSPMSESPQVAVTVGVFGSVAAACAAPLMAQLTQRHGSSSAVRLREIDVDGIPQAVLEGTVDVALALDYPDARRAPQRGLRSQTVHREEFSVVASCTHPLARWAVKNGNGGRADEPAPTASQAGDDAAAGAGEAAPAAEGSSGATAPCGADKAERLLWARLADAHWILPPVDTAFGRATRIACSVNGMEPAERHIVVDSALALGLVADGLGITLATPLMLRMQPAAVRRDLVTIPLNVPAMREIVLITRAADAGRRGIGAVTDALVQTAPWE